MQQRCDGETSDESSVSSRASREDRRHLTSDSVVLVFGETKERERSRRTACGQDAPGPPAGPAYSPDLARVQALSLSPRVDAKTPLLRFCAPR